MLQRLQNAVLPADTSRLAKSFYRLGWIGFWVQITFGSLSIAFMVYHLVFSSNPTISRSGVPFIEYLTIANLLVLLFTIYWSYHYTRLSKRFADPQRPPTGSHVIGVVWTGIVASTAGMLSSMIVLMIEVATLLFFFLRAPQGGIPVVQTGSEAAYWVSSVDMVSLMALVLTLFAELIVLIFSLWLLVRTTVGSPEQSQTSAIAEPAA